MSNSNGVDMTNTNTIPDWDTIFANLANEIAAYDETLARLNDLNQ